MYNQQNNKSKNETPWWMWAIVVVIGLYGLNYLYACTSSGGKSSDYYDPVRPGMGGPGDGAAADIAEWEEEQRQLGDVDRYEHYSETAQAEMTHEAIEALIWDDLEDEFAPENSISGCPYGCRQHQPGCDIKGNVGFNSGERIYHLPWQDYYESTKIDPEYGERWFCTEEEARANGWRRSRE